jgi:acetylornithine deacetylase
VPDLAEAEIDIRLTPSLAEHGGALKLLHETIACHDLKVDIVNPHENPPMQTAPDHPMIQRLLQTDSACQLASAPWFSDAAHLADSGIPSICIGPGSIDQAHTADEFIELPAFEQGADFFTRFIRSLGH